VPVDDTPEQTRRVLQSLAISHEEPPNFTAWHALQEWLEAGEREVEIPFADALAEMVPPVAVRLRRDFGLLLNLIRAHAFLHQATRERDGEGRIVATLEDYEEVRELVVDLMGEAVQATVSARLRETVEAVSGLLAGGADHVMVLSLAERLKLDKSAASRRARAATGGGYLRNLEERRGKPARLVVGDPLPEELEILPTPEAVAERLHGCAVVRGDKEEHTCPTGTDSAPGPVLQAELEVF